MHGQTLTARFRGELSSATGALLRLFVIAHNISCFDTEFLQDISAGSILPLVWICRPLK